MPTGRGRLITADVQSPTQYVLPVGKSGEGFNPFTAPSKWVGIGLNLVSGAAALNVIVCPANRTIRLYRLAYTIYNVAGFPVLLQYTLSGSVIMRTSLLAATNPAKFVDEFSPCGVAGAVMGGNLTVGVTGFNVTCFTFALYSLECWGTTDDGN